MGRLGDIYEAYAFSLILGLPGSGKTSLAMQLANVHADKGWTPIWVSHADSRIPSHPSTVVAISLEQAVDFCLYGVDGIVPAAPLICIDELELWCPRDERPSEVVSRLVKVRRHVRIALLGTAQDPWAIHPKVRRMWSRLYFFQLDESGKAWLKSQQVPADSLDVGDATVASFDRHGAFVFRPFLPNPVDWIAAET